MPRWRKPAVASLLASFFFLVSWDTLKAPFAADEMMAIYWYWHPSPWRLLTSQFMLWKGYVRPLGGLFYLPTFLVYGLNPVPFHALLLVLLLAGAYLMYRLARALGCDELPSAMVALIACYHGGLSNLYFNSVFVFDVLCGVFYFAALAYYARIRGSGNLLNARQQLAFLGLFLCALNAKEMAVTLPAMLLAYELIFQPPRGSLIRWLIGPGRGIFWAGLLNVVYIYGKVFGPHSLMKAGGSYSPVYSWERFVDFQERYIGDIFYQLPRVGWITVLAVWIAVTYLVWRRRQPLLRFCWFYILVTPLPMAFLIGRDQACLYVTLAGWAILAAALVMSWLPTLAAEPVFRRLNPHRVKPLLAAGLMIAYALGSWLYKQSVIAPAIPALEPRTEAVLAGFHALKPSVKPGAKVVIMEDPWPDSYDMAFITELWFANRKTTVRLNQKTPLTPDEIAAADAVFTWRDGSLNRLR